MKWFILGLFFYNGQPHEVELGPYATRGNCESQRYLITRLIQSVPLSGAMLYCKEREDT